MIKVLSPRYKVEKFCSFEDPEKLLFFYFQIYYRKSKMGFVIVRLKCISYPFKENPRHLNYALIITFIVYRLN